MENHLHSVVGLPAPARTAVESLIGHRLTDDQQLFIVALGAAPDPPADTRRQAWHELQEIISAMQENSSRSGISTAEIERIIDETCDEVRYGKKPCV